MTEREFDQWWKAHRAAFLHIDQWLGKMTTDGERRAGFSDRLHRSEIPESEITQGDVLRNWRSALADVSLKAALDVTAAMSRGDIDKPKDWDDHARFVRRHAHDEPAADPQRNLPKGRLIDGEWVYSCSHCEDLGFRDIWHPKSVAAAESDPDRFLKFGPFLRQVVACTCNEGRRQVQVFEKRREIFPTLSARMYEHHPGAEGKQQLVDEVAAKYVNSGTPWNPDDF